MKYLPIRLWATIALSASILSTTFAAEGDSASSSTWWKGNIHTHSLWSDGDDFPEMIADWYKRHDYHFLALSDHNILSEGIRWMKVAEIEKRGGKEAMTKYFDRFGDEWVETRGTPGQENYEVRLQPLDRFRALLEVPQEFLMIQGEEISDKAEGVPVHLGATNVLELLEPMGGRTVAESIDNNLRAAEEQAKRTGKEILVHLNHPNFGYAITAEELASVLRERFVEVYNGHPGVNHLGDDEHASVERIWDVANTIRIDQLNAPPLYGVATDDSHDYHGVEGSTPGRGWIMVRAPELETETLIRAIKAGDLYASSGVTLREVVYDGDTRTLRLDIEPEEGATFTTEFIGTRVGYDSKSEPRLDKDGKPRRTTQIYSEDIGEVFAKVEGLAPSYELTGDELYVRAVVTSSKVPANPSFEGQRQQAWTQPVGWEERVSEPASARIGKQR